eukprot:scaffold38339_cov18-Tisochrysis_lutea.AAC.1
MLYWGTISRRSKRAHRPAAEPICSMQRERNSEPHLSHLRKNSVMVQGDGAFCAWSTCLQASAPLEAAQ